ncbi:aminoglycoside phosphotransferase family protein [Cellulomonas aerilata]|uniref:Aminoglycoside phosphotransferase n=1 Tax=Cellulomonas aerilata TaxID=515326 RepID=A0A512DBR2_9CELL|nr:aminoglycoside phosphotransferase family protein [Cellulomonas aerilata]GEO33670.1 aminoglycoside phosphotransferase [Cellulomonas aerilata]
MATRPPAELDVTTDLVRRLLREQHPDLADLPLRIVSGGWDNVIVRLGDHLAVRVPRRETAARLALHEQRWLPEMADRLGVAIPVPVRAGRPGAGYPWAWTVVPWFDGLPAAGVPRGDRGRLAVPLADVVARLHVAAPPDAPDNPFRGGTLRDRDAVVHERVASGAVPAPDDVLAVWADAAAVPGRSGPPVWLHGDLHPANLLLTADGDLAAVLDFGDLTAGDPATDLATAWLTFDAAARRVFRDRVTDLTGTDGATWVRARGWALAMATALLAHSDDDPAFALLGRETIAQVLAD